MKKTLSAILVILISFFKAKAFASYMDMNVNKVTIESSDATGDKNEGVRRCGSKMGPQ